MEHTHGNRKSVAGMAIILLLTVPILTATGSGSGGLFGIFSGSNSDSVAANTEYSWEEIATHNTIDDAWIVVDGVVYDISRFAKFHPGGNVFQFGADNSRTYHRGHGSNTSRIRRYAIGVVASQTN